MQELGMTQTQMTAIQSLKPMYLPYKGFEKRFQVKRIVLSKDSLY
jgi:hypothetical protein